MARGRSGRRTLMVLLTALVLVLVGGTAGVLGLQAKYDGNIDRFDDPFVAIPPEARPPEPSSNSAGAAAANYLLVGSDSRISAGDPSQWQAGAQRTDAIMLVHAVPEATGGSRSTFAAGTQRMDGETALGYVRQRKNLAGGDLDRVKRQQNWIRSVMSEALSRGTLTNPLRLNSFLDATTRPLSVDEGFGIGEMRDLALSLRSLRSGDVRFLTVPVAGLGRSPDGQSIVSLDEEECATLWAAIGQDDVGTWVQQHDADLLDESVS